MSAKNDANGPPTSEVREGDAESLVDSAVDAGAECGDAVYVPRGAARTNVNYGITRPHQWSWDVVTIAPFCIDRFEVTRLEYFRCVDAGVCQSPRAIPRLTQSVLSDGATTNIFSQENGSLPTYGGMVTPADCSALDRSGVHQDHPMVCASSNDAETYCAYAGGVLPSQEQVVRAADGVLGYDASVLSWIPRPTLVPDPRVARDTQPVGSESQDVSHWGVHDLVGSVDEFLRPYRWGPAVWRVDLGGGAGPPDDVRSNFVGFRCVFPVGTTPRRRVNPDALER